jgi:hypothetical protein
MLRLTMPGQQLSAPEREMESATRSEWGARLFVWGVWALMFAGALAYYWHFRFSVFYRDDWGMYPGLLIKEPFLQWVWALYGDHREPLSKLIWLTELKLFGDPRIGAILHVVGFGGLAFAMIRVAQRVRRRASYTDAFFPVAMLHVSQGFNFIWAFTIVQVLPSILEGVLVLIVVRHGAGLRGAQAVLLGISAVLLALSDTGGLPFAVALGFWLVCWSVVRWRSPDRGGKRAAVWGIALAASIVLLAVLYFLDRQKGLSQNSQFMPAKLGVWATVEATLKVLSVGFGGGVVRNLGGDTIAVWRYAGIAVLCALASTMTILSLVWWRRRAERLRAFGLFLVIGAVFPLAVGIGRARGPLHELAPLAPWYVTYCLPALSCCYLAWQVYAKPAAPFFQMCLFTMACVMLPLNIMDGLDGRRELHETMVAFEKELQNGTPPLALAERYKSSLLFDTEPTYLAEMMRGLRTAGIRPFQSMKDPPLGASRE